MDFLGKRILLGVTGGIAAYKAAEVARRILRRQAEGGRFDEVAVFYRVNSLSRVLEDAFRKNAVPYRIARGVEFYKAHGYGERAAIWLRPYHPAAESPDDEYPFWLCTGRILEHWHTGSMTRRVPILHKAAPESYVEINPDDASRLGITSGSKVKISSRRGSVVMKASINGRGRPPQGMVFVPFFDESYLINEVTLDAFCPISKQPDYKKCAVKLERA